MDITRRNFVTTLAAAPLLSGCTKRKRAPFTLPVDPALQQQEDDYIHFHYHSVYPADEQSQANLGILAREVFDAMPAALPKARFLPPMPNFYIEPLMNRGRPVISFNSAFTSSENGAALSMIISEEALKFTPEEMKMAMANHFAHAIMKLNPNIAAEYKLPSTGIIKNDMETHFIKPVPGHEYNIYKSELCADDIAVRLTHNPDALTSLLTKIDLQGFTDKDAPRPSVAARIESAEATQRRLTKKERSTFIR